MQTAARGQLALYAILLTSGRPHRDFPIDPRAFDALDVSLCEVQLIRGDILDYQLESSEIDIVWSEIGESIVEMQRAQGERGEAYDVTELPMARNAETCARCNFRRLCWPSMAGASRTAIRSILPTRASSRRANVNTGQQPLPF